MANRHGLVTGATGTGKTVTLQLLTDRFSSIGVPVFLADVKGDLSGIAAAGKAVKVVADTLRKIPAIDTERAILRGALGSILGSRRGSR